MPPVPAALHGPDPGAAMLRRLRHVVLICLLGLGAVAWAHEEAPLVIGVLAVQPKPGTLARWQPTAAYLAGQTGHVFTIEPLTYPELAAAVLQRRVDFVITNPSHYMALARRNQLSSPLATLVNLGAGQPLAHYGGVIFTHAGRTDIRRLADLRGRTVATPDAASLGGYQAQALELAEAGLSATRDLNLLITGGPHDSVVEAVLAGRAEAGFVRSGVIEALGVADRVRVVERRLMPGFPLLLSTRLYPEWLLAALPQTDAQLARQVTQALFALHPEHPAAVAGRYHGWAIASDYEPVRAMLQALRLPPYDQAPEFTWRDILSRYGSVLGLAGAAGGIILALLYLLAVRQRQLRQQEQRLSEERRRLLAALGEGVYGVDAQGRCTFVNPAALAMLGCAEADLLGHDLIHPPGGQARARPSPVQQTLQDGQVRRVEENYTRKDGSEFPVEMTVAPIESHDGGAVVVFHDIVKRKRLEAELQALAITDPLTGLPNRRHFLAMLEQETRRLQRFPEASAALLMLDLDHFKRVNDQYGHAAGDAVLRHFGTLLQGRLRRTDLAGRIGGEEFAVLLVGSRMAGAVEFAEQLREQVRASAVEFDGQRLGIGVSIGVTVLDRDDASVDAPLARADRALYRAKEQGRDRVESG